MSVQPLSKRPAARLRAAEKFVEKAFTDQIEAKAALIVVHRVVRAETDDDKARAMDLLLQYARLHPLPKSLERLL